uniref:FAD-binding domain-containing protein n=1 Tax=Clastoptera arizonana TaxID=38151 RepID=A0A1B6DBJ4_9HEMI
MTLHENAPKLKVIIIGGGLVGSLSACYFGKHGHEVHLYELREDIRKTEMAKGKSINLAMSNRGRKALRAVGLEEEVLQQAIPMKARMIHNKDGTLHQVLYDYQNQQCIYSVSRKHLNELLLTAAEKYQNVKTHFNHKLISADLENGNVTFELQDKQVVTYEADLIVGADGVYSAVRKQMLKMPMFNYSQTYIDHGYMELVIPSTHDNQFAMLPNFLHIWPRGTFMLIALPNQDRSWTVTLFMPFNQFALVKTQDEILDFFQQNFPDAIPLIGRKRLVDDFLSSKASTLISIKCQPYNVGSHSIIIGDAAHGMVPFYGQGMNAGFEDCRLLDELLTKFNWNLTIALNEFSTTRNPNAQAICDLAIYNYIEMRDLVAKKVIPFEKIY